MKPIYTQIAILVGYFAFLAGMWMMVKKFLDRMSGANETA